MRVNISMEKVAPATALLAVVIPVMVSGVAALRSKKMPHPVAPLLLVDPLGLAFNVVWAEAEATAREIAARAATSFERDLTIG